MYKLKRTLLYLLLLVAASAMLVGWQRTSAYTYNYGLHRSSSPQNIYLTIDLCPSSKKGFDKELF